MGKRYLIFILINISFFVSTILNTACATDTTDNNETVEKILSSMGDLSSYTAEYKVYNYGKLVFIGNMKYKKPDLYKKIHYSSENKEYQIVEVCDGIYKWRYAKAFNSVEKSMQNAKSIDFIISPALLSDKNSLHISYLGSANINGIKNHKILLEEKDHNFKKINNATKVLFMVRDKIGTITKIDYYDKNDTVDISVLFENYHVNIEMPNSEFQFTMPAGAYFNDLTKQKKGAIKKIRGKLTK